MKLTVDTADIVGLYLIIQRVAGKGQVKVLVAGLGWAFAELILTRLFSYGLELVALNSIGNTFKTVSKPTSGEFS